MTILYQFIVGFLFSLFCLPLVWAASLTIPMYLVDDHGQSNIGTVTVKDMRCGMLLIPNIHQLPPGIHGFHIHEKPLCADKGMAAGGHLDPKHSNKHQGPYQPHGHKGDLPVLIVDKNGQSNLPIFAPFLSVAEIKNHALMIHADSDNYSDYPEKLGGGGARIACGVIQGRG